MVEDNVQLIRRILAGDDEAFSILMRRHQKRCSCPYMAEN